MLLNGLQRLLEDGNLFFVLVDVELRDPANRNLQEFFPVFVGRFAEEFFPERFERVGESVVDSLERLDRFDFLVEPVFNEDPLEGFVEDPLEEFFPLEFEFPLEEFDEFFRVVGEDFVDVGVDYNSSLLK